jgi:hypothetical protein
MKNLLLYAGAAIGGYLLYQWWQSKQAPALAPGDGQNVPLDMGPGSAAGGAAGAADGSVPGAPPPVYFPTPQKYTGPAIYAGPTTPAMLPAPAPSISFTGTKITAPHLVSQRFAGLGRI